jgi:prophage antirepressor-like protein
MQSPSCQAVFLCLYHSLAHHGEASGIRKDPDDHRSLGAPTPPAPIGGIPETYGVLMTTQVVPFMFETQSQIRVVMIDGEPWFVAVDICSALGLDQVTRALDRLDDDEKQVIDFSTLLNSKGVKNQTLNPGQKINIINESGLYSLIMTSRKPEAKKFRKWVTSEVLPSLRKTGSYSIANESMASLASHTVRATQIGNSKAVNHVQVALGGAQAAIQYNIKNCTIQSGRTPAEWKRQAKDEKMLARLRNSAKDVLRVKHPQIACGMSLADELVAGGATQDDGISIGKESQHIFQRILSLGITPRELLI